MRINTDGSQAYREDLYEEAADLFDEGTKVGGVHTVARSCADRFVTLRTARIRYHRQNVENPTV